MKWLAKSDMAESTLASPKAERNRACLLGAGAAAVHVGFDQQLGAAAEADAIDLQGFQDARDVIARLRERYALHPVDRVDFRIARVAEARDPLLHPSAAGVIA